MEAITTNSVSSGDMPETVDDRAIELFYSTELSNKISFDKFCRLLEEKYDAMGGIPTPEHCTLMVMHDLDIRINATKTYKYRRIFVKDGQEITVPQGSKCMQLRRSFKDRSFVEFLEPTEA